VGILPDVPEVTIGADTGIVVFSLGRDGAPEGPGYALPRARFQPEGALAQLRLLEAATLLPAALVVPAGPAETLSANGAPYRGYLEIRAGEGRLRVVNVVNIEDYLRGVVPNELSPGAASGLEAIKAQAVAARTYALRQRGRYAAEGYDVCATQACQVYRGRASEHPRADEAVAATRGRILGYRGAPIKALYTSACGGHTEDVENVFGGDRETPYLRGVVCTSERSAGVPTRAGRWQVRMSPDELARVVSRYGTLTDVRDVQPRRVGVSGRVVELAVIGGGQQDVLVLKGLDVRRGLGLRESLFVMDRDTDAKGAVRRFVFTGKGWGHGVGLCQAGALGMARAGARYAQILTHYYTGVTLQKAY